MDTLVVNTPLEITENKWPQAKPAPPVADSRDDAIAALMALAHRAPLITSTPASFSTPKGGDADAAATSTPFAPAAPFAPFAAPFAASAPTLKRHRFHQHQDDQDEEEFQGLAPLKRALCHHDTAPAPVAAPAPAAPAPVAPAPVAAPAAVLQSPHDLFGGMTLTTGSRKETKRFRERGAPASDAAKALGKNMAALQQMGAVWEYVENSKPHVHTDATACTKPAEFDKPQRRDIKAAIKQAIHRRVGHSPLAALAAYAHMYNPGKTVPRTLKKLISHSSRKYGPKWCELPAAMYASRPPHGMFRCILVRINGQLLEDPPTFVFPEELRPALSFVPLCTDNETSLPDTDERRGDKTFVLAHAPLSARRRIEPFDKGDCVIATAHSTSFTVCIRSIGKHQVAVYDHRQAHYVRSEYQYPSNAVKDYVYREPELAPFRTVHGITA